MKFVVVSAKTLPTPMAFLVDHGVNEEDVQRELAGFGMDKLKGLEIRVYDAEMITVTGRDVTAIAKLIAEETHGR